MSRRSRVAATRADSADASCAASASPGEARRRRARLAAIILFRLCTPTPGAQARQCARTGADSPKHRAKFSRACSSSVSPVRVQSLIQTRAGSSARKRELRRTGNSIPAKHRHRELQRRKRRCGGECGYRCNAEVFILLTTRGRRWLRGFLVFRRRGGHIFVHDFDYERLSRCRRWRGPHLWRRLTQGVPRSGIMIPPRWVPLCQRKRCERRCHALEAFGG